MLLTVIRLASRKDTMNNWRTTFFDLETPNRFSKGVKKQLWLAACHVICRIQINLPEMEGFYCPEVRIWVCSWSDLMWSLSAAAQFQLILLSLCRLQLVACMNAAFRQKEKPLDYAVCITNPRVWVPGTYPPPLYRRIVFVISYFFQLPRYGFCCSISRQRQSSSLACLRSYKFAMPIHMPGTHSPRFRRNICVISYFIIARLLVLLLLY